MNKVGTGCASTASSVTIVPNNWIGGTGNWNVAANWSGNAVPDGVSDITISSGTPTLDVDFTLPAGKSLAISGTGSLIVAPGKRLTLAGTADFGDRPVTFSSTSSGTACLGQVTGTLNNATNVTVERYLPLGRKWRLLTAPLKGSTNNSIFYNWQNNDAISAGRGVEIWSAAGDADPSNINSGLAIGGGASMRAYGTTGWTNVTNTNTTLLFDNSTNFGYALFATGPYNNGTSLISPTDPAQNTTLSATGTLITGDHTKTFNAGSGGQYFLVGNPYASPVDPRSFTATGTINRTNLNDKLWMWDAKPGPGIGNGLGKYVSFDLSINQFNLYSDGYPDDNVMIQSGQAFFVQSAASGTATLIFRESSKNASGSHAMMGNSTSSSKARLRLTLQQPVTGDSVLNLDGAVAVFHAEGRTAIDPLDGAKLVNSAENLFFRREEKSLTFEHHPKVTATDTLFVRMINLQARSYKLQLQAADFSDTDSLTAALIDRFTGKTHPISLKGSSDHTFTVTLDSLSTGDRFLVVLTKATAPILMKPDAQEGSYGVKLFPNPVHNRLRVSMGVSDTGPYSITVINAAGVEIWKKSGIQPGTKTVDVNASDFHSGVYMLILRDAKGDVRVDRFVKE